MKKELLLGPLLSLEGPAEPLENIAEAPLEVLVQDRTETENRYSICFLTNKVYVPGEVSVNANGMDFKVEKVTDTIHGTFWRSVANIPVAENGKLYKYTITLKGVELSNADWHFYVPGRDEAPKFSYTSCNGFSSVKLLKDTDKPYNLWTEMNKTHFKKKEYFSLLIMGGDQLYADGIWTSIPELAVFSEANEEEQKHMTCDQQVVEEFYEDLYIQRWNEPNQARAFAGIPNIMMWDDHDIFDGWGSFPEPIQTKFEVYKTIFAAAKKYFKLFQLRGREDLFSKSDDYFAYKLHFRNYSILAMDHRAERTIKRVMYDGQWESMIQWFQKNPLRKNLLVMSAVPLVYRDFSFVESYEDKTPWAEETEDDLRDHWRAREHQGERLKLIQQLLSELKIRDARRTPMVQQGVPMLGQPNLTAVEVKQLWQKETVARTVILSGDVHVGSLGVIMDRRESKTIKIHQVISSGIVHPPPGPFAWLGILTATNDRNEYLNEDKTIETSIISPIGSDKYIRARNFATLQEGGGKLWINWVNETKDKAEYPLD